MFEANFLGELTVDGFAGGGGVTSGFAKAIGRPVDHAINHDPVAIRMHEVNHPETMHYCESIYRVDPVKVANGEPVGAAWFSPTCTHFSRAKGTVPLDSRIRGLAWMVTRWAKTVRPRVIFVENVVEFQTWGPLGPDGRPDKKKLGKTFRAWLSKLRSYGYAVEHRVLCAADYGAATTRKRFFLVARCDGMPIMWPEPTHGPGRAHAWKPAADIIDWSLPVQSIFGRKKPLVDATRNRIAAGIRKFILEAEAPYIRPSVAHNNQYLELVEPFLVRHGHYSRKTGAGLIAGRGAGTFRGQPLREPIATICATNDKHLIAPIITKHYGGPNGHATPGQSVDAPLGTVTAKDHHALVVAFLMKYYGASGDAQGQQLGLPLHTVTTKSRFALVTVHVELYRIVDIRMRMLAPKELFAAHGFPKDYNIRPTIDGAPITVGDQIRLVGNSVPPVMAELLVRANAYAWNDVAMKARA